MLPAGIFEMKWDPEAHVAGPCLALALTDGSLVLVESPCEDSPKVICKSYIDQGALSTCVDFKRGAASQERVLGASTSNGSLAIVKVRRC